MPPNQRVRSFSCRLCSDFKECFALVDLFASFVFQHHLEARCVFAVTQRQVLKRLPALYVFRHWIFDLLGFEYLDELLSVAADFVENRVHLLYFATELVTNVEHVVGEECKVCLLACQDLYWLLGMLVLNYDALLVYHVQKVLGV